jgi:hypothetical protein
VVSRTILQSPDYAKYIRISAWSLPCAVFVVFETDVLRLTFQPWKFFLLNVLQTVGVASLSILFVVGAAPRGRRGPLRPARRRRARGRGRASSSSAT